MCGAVLMSGARPYLLCVVPGFTFDTPAYVQCPGCFAYVRCGAVLCFDRARGASTAPAYVLCFAYFDSPWPYLRQPPALLCLAWPYLRQPLALLRQPPGVLTCLCPALLCLAWLYLRHPPGVLCLRALLCFALFCFAYVFPTHTEGGDPGSLHEKKIKTKEF